MSKHMHWAPVLLLLAGAASAQTCGEDFPPGLAQSHFQDNGDGTVTDLETGLIWKRCAEGLRGPDCSEGRPGVYTYPQALRRAADAEFADSTLWRLPSKEELATLVDRGCEYPAIDRDHFPNTPSGWFWSSTSGAGYPYYAWSVHFGDGRIGNDSGSGAGHVRLLRYGP